MKISTKWADSGVSFSEWLVYAASARETMVIAVARFANRINLQSLRHYYVDESNVLKVYKNDN